MRSIRPVRTVSLFLSYLLVILLCTPFAVTARPASAKRISGSTQERSPARYREGELLVRFREESSQKDKETILTTHGVRRTKQLGGQSRLERLELTAGRDAKAAALQLLMNPQVELAELNFLISKDEIGRAHV